MKINALKLHIQDMPDKKGDMFAAVSGKLILDTGDIALQENGKDARLDEQGDTIPILEDINFMFPLNKEPKFKQMIQDMCIEALTLKNMEIAQEHGQLSHFVKAVGGTMKKKKKGLPKIKRKKKK